MGSKINDLKLKFEKARTILDTIPGIDMNLNEQQNYYEILLKQFKRETDLFNSYKDMCKFDINQIEKQSREEEEAAAAAAAAATAAAGTSTASLPTATTTEQQQASNTEEHTMSEASASASSISSNGNLLLPTSAPALAQNSQSLFNNENRL